MKGFHDERAQARLDAQGRQLARLLRLNKEMRRKVAAIEERLGLSSGHIHLGLGRPVIRSMDDGDPGRCIDCDESYEWVRPGKSQPTCDCHEICPVHGPGKIVYHKRGEVAENISGYFCADCWG